MLKLKMYPARNGDAFLVDAAGTYILIDAGFASTYQDFIKPDLESIARAGGRLALAVCTHIDADHIGGLLEFFSSNGPVANRVVDVTKVWHNSLRSLPGPPAVEEGVRDRMVLEAIRRRGVQSAASSAPISARQGSSLANLLRQYGYVWNTGDGTTCISQDEPPVNLSETVSVQVVGPSRIRLEALRDAWLREVSKLGYKGVSASTDLTDDAYEMWCATAPQPPAPQVRMIAANRSQRLADVYVPDQSLSNGSSIALSIDSASGRMLLLGDAWAEDVVARIREMQPAAGPIFFDAIKVSHHGSLRNTSPELLAIADAHCFLISSDGSRHGHPDFEVLAEIVDRPAVFERRLIFNYETAGSRRLRSHTSRSGAPFSVHIADNNWIQLGEHNND
jgi:beta-lactamase superfamily II metal-dependent hydrolase